MDELVQLFDASPRRDYLATRRLLVQNSVGTDVWMLDHGVVRIVVEDEGVRHLLGFRGRGALLGEVAVLGAGRRSADVIAVKKITVRRLHREDFLTAFRTSPVLAKQLVLAAARDRHESEVGHARMGIACTEARLADSLIRLATAVWNSERLEGLSQQDLCKLIGVKRTSLHHALSVLREAGAIRGRAPLVIQSLDALREISRPAD